MVISSGAHTDKRVNWKKSEMKEKVKKFWSFSNLNFFLPKRLNILINLLVFKHLDYMILRKSTNRWENDLMVGYICIVFEGDVILSYLYFICQRCQNLNWVIDTKISINNIK